MTLNELSRLRILPVVLMAALTAGTALAERPEWTGQGQRGRNERKGQDKGKKQQQDRQAKPEVRIGGNFGDQQRAIVRDYYDKQYRAGRCPPGLAKKNNGCMPPGQAKKWAVGQRLPRDVVYYQVPQSVVIGLGGPPAGHKYVRVASDILLVALATNLIVDAIPALGRP